MNTEKTLFFKISTSSSLDEATKLIEEIGASIDPDGTLSANGTEVRMGAGESSDVFLFVLTVASNISTGIVASYVYDLFKNREEKKVKISIKVDDEDVTIETKDAVITIKNEADGKNSLG